MKLILNGGGSDAQIKESYELFAREVGNGKVLYIPLAWANGNMADCIDWFKGQVLPYGITNIEQALDANEITNEKLANIKGVFIGGGNTYQLLKSLKQTPAFDNLKNFMKRDDTIIMGGSAGALIFGKSIDTCKDDGLGIKSICDVNNVGLQDCTGFDVLGGYSLLVHYKKVAEQIPQTERRIQRLLDEGYKLICLPEETSVYLNDGDIKIVGEKPAELIYKSRKVINAGENVLIQDNLNSRKNA